LRDSRSHDQPPLIERASPRAVFASLVADALAAAPAEPSPMATAYLIDLLEERVRTADSSGAGPDTLAEAWLAAVRETGSQRLQRLRDLGDRALFVSGYFGASLTRSVVGRGYYRDMGRTAYGSLAVALGSPDAEGSWRRLFEELADRFAEFTLVLSEVSDRVYRDRPEWLLGLYDRYLATGSSRDRARLIGAGCSLPPRPGRPQ
jgi:hypothetical protein